MQPEELKTRAYENARQLESLVKTIWVPLQPVSYFYIETARGYRQKLSEHDDAEEAAASSSTAAQEEATTLFVEANPG